jgi:hypothetical protein
MFKSSNLIQMQLHPSQLLYIIPNLNINRLSNNPNIVMGKKKPFLRKIAKLVAAPVKLVSKLPREAIRVIDQGLGIGNKALEKTGIDKFLSGGGSVGIATTSGSHGGSNIHYRPAGSTNSIGVGISNVGNPSLFVGNQVAASLTAPPANFIQKMPDSKANKATSVHDRIAERDQLLQEAYGPGYIPESSLATMGVFALGSAARQFLNDNLHLANAAANLYMDTYVNIYSANDSQRAEAWGRNQELVTNTAQAISKALVNPRIIEEYYYNKFQEASNSFASAYKSGDLTSAGNAVGLVVYDTCVISSVAAGATALTSKVASNFRPPMVFQFNGASVNPAPRPSMSTRVQPRVVTPVPVPQLTKGQLTEFLQTVDQMPVEQISRELQRLGLELLEYRPDINIYKFSHVKNGPIRGTGTAKANLESSKIMVEVHCDAKSGPHMHIVDANGNLYDKNLNNLTAKYRRENPSLAEKTIEKRVERLPEAHIRIKEFVDLRMRPTYE